jgi:alpha-tubulin suppressor-like RCC1 family protein
MKMHRMREQGFALPTIVIASLVLFMVLVAAVGSASSIRASLDTQFFQQLAKDAAESGSAQANECLANNNYLATWTNASPLRPNTNCNGGAACTDVAKCFVVKTPNYNSSYSVGSVTDAGSGVQTFTITATVSLTRASTGAAWKTYSSTSRIQTGGQVNTKSVVFGYTSGGSAGAFFSIVGADGILRSVGLNQNGQLGDGTLNNATSPVKFDAPTTLPIVAAYSNFLSAGNSIVAVDSAGNAYAAGLNDHGQLGVGSTSTNVTTPMKVILPAGARVTGVTIGGATTFYVLADGNVYVAGDCNIGQLGTGVGSGCTDARTPVRVGLPTPNPADPNTMPTTDLVSDGWTSYIRMAGGRVYVWGAGWIGQTASGTGAKPYSVLSPVTIGTYGQTGQPKATKIFTDGGTIFILDDTGTLKSAGSNRNGQAGNNSSEIYNNHRGVCVTASTNLINVTLAGCNAGVYQLFQHRSDLTFYNATTNRCLEVQADARTVRQNVCSTSNYQKFNYVNPLYYKNVQTGACFNNANADGVTFEVYPTCDNATYPTENWEMTNTKLMPFTAPGMTGLITKISSDQESVSVMTSTGEVWSAGLNTSGQFGNGTTGWVQYTPVKFNLPVGVKAVDIYATNVYINGYIGYQNLMVVGDNGKVYGAGGNLTGQLGNGTTSGLSANPNPVAVNGIDGVTIQAKSVQSGRGTTVIFANGNRVYAVGNNANGQLGDPLFTGSYSTSIILNQYVNKFIPIQY